MLFFHFNFIFDSSQRCHLVTKIFLSMCISPWRRGLFLGLGRGFSISYLLLPKRLSETRTFEMQIMLQNLKRDLGVALSPGKGF